VKEAFDAYVNRILQYVELNKKNHDDLKIEFTTYLKERQLELQEEGLDAKEAADSAMDRFGNEKQIGKELAKTTLITPLRKSILTSLMLINICLLLLIPLCIAIYAPYDVTPPYRWALIMVIFTGIWFTFYRRPYHIAKFRGGFITVQILYAIILGYGIFWTDGYQPTWPSIVITILLLAQYFLLFINIILGAILQPMSKNLARQTKKHRTFVTIMNLISGILISAIFLLQVIGFFFFASGLDYLISLLGPVFLVLLLWIITCIISSKIPKLLPLTAIIQISISTYVVYTFYFM
jgi:hypothetical protein